MVLFFLWECALLFSFPSFFFLFFCAFARLSVGFADFSSYFFSQLTMICRGLTKYLMEMSDTLLCIMENNTEIKRQIDSEGIAQV